MRTPSVERFETTMGEVRRPSSQRSPRTRLCLRVPRSLTEFVADWWVRVTDREYWRTMKLVRRGQKLPQVKCRPRRRGSVWGIVMVKNEADVIEAFVTHAFTQGLDCLLIMDNGSSDGTREKLNDLSSTHHLLIGEDQEPGYFQAHKMSRLAWAAWRGGADWVVPMDADEFWLGEQGTLAQDLGQRTSDVVTAKVYNVFPTPRQPQLTAPTGPVRFDHEPGPHDKVCARSFPGMWFSVGNHFVSRPGRREGTLKIVHLPWRSFEQYQRKVTQGASALARTNLALDLGSHWRVNAGMSKDVLRERWKNLLRGSAPDDMTWRPGPQASEVTLLGATSWGDVLRATQASTE